MPEKDCAFCDIDSESGRVINSGKLFTSFLSNPRLSVGHTLVIPNRHVEDLESLTPGELVDMMGEAQRISHRLRNIAVGVDLFLKSRPLVPEDDIKQYHAHLHVVASNPDDRIYSEGLLWTPDRFSPLDEEERQAMLELLW